MPLSIFCSINELIPLDTSLQLEVYSISLLSRIYSFLLLGASYLLISVSSLCSILYWNDIFFCFDFGRSRSNRFFLKKILF
ncbi:hypothetical protein RchiOBHm_Chr6g0271971 [Rosa chinensis]|uniref:Uncharacterized protein n=1 Tax=Rosa chinensis TaxID=74649 RepID=A0A2P6PR65_ROSCH|nr:hypothetical protein RchiOBHm_Chr6g0271971 [Rosa chinensis]